MLILLEGRESRLGDPYMMSPSEGRGGHGKRDVVKEVACMNIFQMRKRGRGSKNQKFLRTLLVEAP